MIFNTNSLLGNDSAIEDFSCLGPRGLTRGMRHIGHRSAIGIGAVLRKEIDCGENTIVGEGAAGLHDVGSDQVAYGMPTRFVRSRKPVERYH